MRFDPMTGEPIKEDTGIRYDPMTGEPIRQDSRKVKLPSKLVVGGIIAALAVVIVLIVVSSGLFLSKPGKIMTAAVNTVKDVPHFVKVLKPLKVLKGNKYTVAFSYDTGGLTVDGEWRNNADKKQAAVELGANGETLKMLAVLDKKAVKVQVPALSDYVFTYYYRDPDNNTGYLFQNADKEEIEELNAAFRFLREHTNIKEISSDLYDVLRKEIKRISFKKAKKKMYTVNGKDVNCKGYTAVITNRNLIHIVDSVQTLIDEKYADFFDVESDDYAEMFDELRDRLQELDDIELTFYIYKRKLAAIIFEASGQEETAELCFEGGDYRMQNMVFKSGNYRLRVTGSDDGKAEQVRVEERISGTNTSDIVSLEYNYKSGEFLIKFQEMECGGALSGSGSKLNFKLNYITVYDLFPSTVHLNIDITLKKGARMEKISGKAFDLGSADKSDCKELLDDIKDRIYDGDYDRLMRFWGIDLESVYDFWN